MNIRFAEKIHEHAKRLGTAFNFARVRRRLLIEKLGGQAINYDTDDIPLRLADATAEELMTTLCVKSKDDQLTTRGGILILLVPDLQANRRPTQDLLEGKLANIARKITGSTYGGEGLPRDALIPPYGYRWSGEEWVADPLAADAVVDAFLMIVNPDFRNSSGRYCGSVAWKLIAETLNKQGYSRRDGQAWQGDDVRTLVRVPTYCGYVYHQKTTQTLEPLDQLIPVPLVPPKVFLRAAQLGRGNRKGMHWVDKLESLLNALATTKPQLRG